VVHTVVAGEGGIDVLAFGPRIDEEATHLPRAGLLRIQNTWTEAGGGDHPFVREAAAGPPELPDAPSPRPPTIVALDAVPSEHKRDGRMDMERRNVGEALG